MSDKLRLIIGVVGKVIGLHCLWL